MDYLEKIMEFFVQGESVNHWLIAKFAMAFIGGFSANFFKNFHYSPGETKVDFLWRGFGYSLISAIGGLCIIGPETAANAFVAGLLGWSAIATVLKQENEGASQERFIDSELTVEQIEDQLIEA